MSYSPGITVAFIESVIPIEFEIIVSIFPVAKARLNITYAIAIAKANSMIVAPSMILGSTKLVRSLSNTLLYQSAFLKD